ncbi:hypothetical protein [Paraburkholderia sp. RL17-381-BIF-C]|jgi:hypothetical protein|uniref:hypothetical protein n=1 Tax=Paraburkholderia sp. RL17-381-BIF-C TaxID=3031635 RepID=UPI0038BB3649
MSTETKCPFMHGAGDGASVPRDVGRDVGALALRHAHAPSAEVLFLSLDHLYSDPDSGVCAKSADNRLT